MVWEFLRYWSAERLNDKMNNEYLGKIACLLIEQSRLAKQVDCKYYTSFRVLFRLFEESAVFTGNELTTLVNNLVDGEKEGGKTFNWDWLAVVFTLGHEILQKFPHHYLEVKQMLWACLNKASDDIEKLGVWTKFVDYSAVIWKVVLTDKFFENIFILFFKYKYSFPSCVKISEL